MLSATDASLRGRIGAHVLHSTHDPRVTTAPARKAFLARFEIEVDPDNLLDPAERQRRAEHARSAYFSRLVYRRWKVDKAPIGRAE